MTILECQSPAEPVVSRWNYSSFEVTNRLGLHARPAMILAYLFARCPGEIWAAGSKQIDANIKDLEYVDATSILQLMLLGVSKGSYLHIRYSAENHQLSEAFRLIPRVFNGDDLGISLERILERGDVVQS